MLLFLPQLRKAFFLLCALRPYTTAIFHPFFLPLNILCTTLSIWSTCIPCFISLHFSSFFEPDMEMSDGNRVHVVMIGPGLILQLWCRVLDTLCVACSVYIYIYIFHLSINLVSFSQAQCLVFCSHQWWYHCVCVYVAAWRELPCCYY